MYRLLRKEVRHPGNPTKLPSPKPAPRPQTLQLVFAALLLVACLLVRLCMTNPPTGEPLDETCVEFIITHTNSMDGVPLSRNTCDTRIRREGGYCVCSGRLAVPAKRKRRSNITCDHLCAASPAESARKIPELAKCSKGQTTFFPSAPAPLSTPQWRMHLIMPWWKRMSESLHPSDRAILPPGKRTAQVDFVALGRSMQPEHRAMARQDWKDFVKQAGPYPASSFSGQGIAILSGDMKYLVPSLITLKALRRVGCQLPVELWFPSTEPPPDALAAKLKRLGATARMFTVPPVLGKGGFYMKSIVLMLSSFKEVILLDADQVPVTNPTVLFSDPGYKQTGALLWADFWSASWAPDLPSVLGVPAEDMPTGTFESGQMVFDKSKTWPALALALHFNIHHHLYAPLFTYYVGMGDKESYVMALLALKMKFTEVEHYPGSLGFTKPRCSWFSCAESLATNSMMQHAPDGSMMFIHANMPPKWYLAVPEDWQMRRRRWVMISPGPDELVQNFSDISEHVLGFDPEKWVHEQLVALQCDADIRSAAHTYDMAAPSKQKHLPSLSNSRLPYLPAGLDLMEFYERFGLDGKFVEQNHPKWWQRIRHWVSLQRFGRRKWWKHIYKNESSKVTTLGDIAAGRY